MTERTTEQATTYTVLFVDDEPNILRAIKRALFTMDITLLLADSGAKALDLMSKHDVHVVISDMKMPQMSGAELLEQVAINYPETFRVVLTGYADIESTIKAVNQGKIHRYLQKPWDNQELIAVVEEGLERVKLKAENLRLQKLTRLQNKKLRDVNASLEQVVQKRTRQIKAALNKIEKHNLAMEQVLFNVISINPDINGKFAIEVSELASKLARIARLEKEEIKQEISKSIKETFNFEKPKEKKIDPIAIPPTKSRQSFELTTLTNISRKEPKFPLFEKEGKEVVSPIPQPKIIQTELIKPKEEIVKEVVSPKSKVEDKIEIIQESISKPVPKIETKPDIDKEVAKITEHKALPEPEIKSNSSDDDFDDDLDKIKGNIMKVLSKLDQAEVE